MGYCSSIILDINTSLFNFSILINKPLTSLLPLPVFKLNNKSWYQAISKSHKLLNLSLSLRWIKSFVNRWSSFSLMPVRRHICPFLESNFNIRLFKTFLTLQNVRKFYRKKILIEWLLVALRRIVYIVYRGDRRF